MFKKQNKTEQPSPGCCGRSKKIPSEDETVHAKSRSDRTMERKHYKAGIWTH